MKRTRRPKPRPTYVLEPLIKDVEQLRRTIMQRYTANEYDTARRLDSQLVRLYAELREARKRYLPPQN